MTTPLTDAQVSEIKQLLLENELTQQQIGEKYDRSRSLISDIATNRIYRDIEPKLLPNRIPGGHIKHLNLEQQNLALIGQVENLREERNLLKRQLKAAAKRDAVVDEIVERLAPIVKPMPKPKKVRQPADKKTVKETLVLLLSDVHADQVVTPEEVDGLECFDFLIATRRAEILVADTLDFALRSLSNFNFEKLVILGLGDYTSGGIHGHARRSFFGDAFSNDLAIAQLFAYMFAELSAHFETVEVVNIIGNHGRLTEKYEFTHDAVPANHDTLIMKIAQVHCKNIDNIQFVFPGGLSHIHHINGWNFYLHHGHGQKGGSETWSRAKRKSQTIVPLHKGNVHYIVTGHFHTEGAVRVSGGATLIGNGAFLATDPYAYQAIEEAGEPCQLVFGVHKERGVTWRLPIKIRTPDEDKGPQRYPIPMLEQ